MPNNGNSGLDRHCLVTIGATAQFTQLLTEIVEQPFLEEVASSNFTHLTVQCGNDLEWFRKNMHAALSASPELKFQLKMFSFVDDLVPEMTKCRAEPGKRRDGLVVCHAGTGTILGALRVNCPLVVVPNPTLKDNHQEELAEEMQNQGYAIWGNLGSLHEAIRSAERLSDANTRRWGPHPVSEAPAPAANAATSESETDSANVNLDLWGITSAMMDRYAIKSGKGKDVAENQGPNQGTGGSAAARAAATVKNRSGGGSVPGVDAQREETTQMAFD